MPADNDNMRENERTVRCPNCGHPAVSDFRPFCSGRCKDVDLSRWLRGSYAIPAGGVDEDEDGDSAALEIETMRQAANDDAGKD